MTTKGDNEVGVQDDFTQDGTTNLKGKPVLRRETGRWKACYFMLGKLFFIIYVFYTVNKLVMYERAKNLLGSVRFIE
ncbi:hypothetical protein HanLR1_Chr05g0187161 [Helianthus annuus]|nr:hypothetical protein HanLR1_Chr05g0187161 [Helianthus annuus]